MPEFSLHPALQTDAPKIRDLIHRVGINPLNLDWERFTVAETDGGKFIGCCQLKHHPDGSTELASLAVEADHRRQGVAHALIGHFLAHSPRPLYLMCRRELVRYYEKYGFRAITFGTMPPYFRRILRFIQVMVPFSKRAGPAVMRLG